MSCRGFEEVCTGENARKYFEECGLTYKDIESEDITELAMLVRDELKKSNESGETSSEMRLNKKIDIFEAEDSGIRGAFLYMDSHYFKEREAISFNGDGFIGFAGWADIGNRNPIMRAFMIWCERRKK